MRKMIVKFHRFGPAFCVAIILVTQAFVGASANLGRAQSSAENPRKDTKLERTEREKATKRAKPEKLTKEQEEHLLGATQHEYNSILKIARLPEDGRVKLTDQFIIAYNTSDPYVEWIAALTDEVAEGFERFLRKMKIDYERPEKRMYVFLFAQRSAMDAFEATLYKLARQTEKLENRANRPAGFYVHAINRMVIYDQTELESARVEAYGEDGGRKSQKTMTRAQVTREARELKTRDNAVYNTETIVHELTHQLSYNYGLLPMKGGAPSWYVEGLAMLFETSDGSAALGWRYKSVLPINPIRYMEFCHYANNASNSSLVDELIASDQAIERLRGEAYALSWALVYYCYKKRTKEFAKFMKLCRDKPAPRDDQDARRKNFEECFGNVNEFKVEFIKYMNSL